MRGRRGSGRETIGNGERWYGLGHEAGLGGVCERGCMVLVARRDAKCEMGGWDGMDEDGSGREEVKREEEMEEDVREIECRAAE
jgi:hypothetical protein